MTIAAEYKSLNQVLSDFNQIIIPDVQRDYVMGSGGNKLEELLHAMIAVVQKKDSKNELFNFSCLVGYKDNENNLHIYDGQQRLVTLVYLCSYLNNENVDLEKKLLLEKFCFTNRSKANEWLRNPNLIEDDNATDFTTYSLVKLIKQFKAFSDEFDFDFLFNRVVFSLVLVDKISDAEQFFLDINDGLNLKTYEIYKAELYHHAKAKLSKEAFRVFALKMENEWLKFFLTYKYEETKYIRSDWKNGKFIEGYWETTEIHCEEEMLIFFLQFCSRMIWIEEHKNDVGYKPLSISWLKEEHIQRLEIIIDIMIIQMKTSSTSKIACINYSNLTGIASKGQHWSINDENYNVMVDLFLKNIFRKEETNKDIIIWAYISKLPFADKNSLYSYLRFLKKILNNYRGINKYAMIFFCNTGISSKRISYARYYVKGIPSYYLENTNEENEELDENTALFLNEIVILNKNCFIQNEGFIKYFLQNCNNEFLRSILSKEQKKQNSIDREFIEKIENLNFINGLVDNFLELQGDELCINVDLISILDCSINQEMVQNDSNGQYKAVLNYIVQGKINISNTIYSDIKIYWKNYCDTYHSQQVSILPHTLCDFFTSENGILIEKEYTSYKKFNDLLQIPDGWFIDGETRGIMQPEENTVNDKKGFASYAGTHIVWHFN